MVIFHIFKRWRLFFQIYKNVIPFNHGFKKQTGSTDHRSDSIRSFELPRDWIGLELAESKGSWFLFFSIKTMSFWYVYKPFFNPSPLSCLLCLHLAHPLEQLPLTLTRTHYIPNLKSPILSCTLESFKFF